MLVKAIATRALLCQSRIAERRDTAMVLNRGAMVRYAGPAQHQDATARYGYRQAACGPAGSTPA